MATKPKPKTKTKKSVNPAGLSSKETKKFKKVWKENAINGVRTPTVAEFKAKERSFTLKPKAAITKMINAWNKGALGCLHPNNDNVDCGRNDYGFRCNGLSVACIFGSSLPVKLRTSGSGGGECDLHDFIQQNENSFNIDAEFKEEVLQLQKFHDGAIGNYDSLAKVNRTTLGKELNKLAKKYKVDAKAISRTAAEKQAKLGVTKTKTK